MQIRNYNKTDQAMIIALFQLNTPNYFDSSEEAELINFLENEIESYFVVELHGKISACGGFNLTEDKLTARISWDIVHPESQGKGLGSKLMEFRIDQISKIESVEQIAVRTSQLVYPFYKKFGFQTVERISDFWAKGFDLIRMERPKTIDA